MVLSRSGVASLTVLGGALVFGVVLGFVLALQPADPDPLEERWKLLGIPEVEFVFLGDFPRGERESLTRELKTAQVIYAEHFGAVTSDFTVYLSTDLQRLNERVASVLGEGQQVGYTCGGLFYAAGAIIVSVQDCPEAKSEGGFLAHEYFHVLQQREGSIPVTGNVWPEWVVEGSAVYAQALVSDARGRIPFDVRREGHRLLWSSLARPLPRDSYSLPDPSQASLFIYQVGFLAIDWLVERTGREAILEFFRLGAHEAAFEQAFGMTLDRFELAFEEHRLEVAPPFEWRVQGGVFDSDGRPFGDVYATATVPIGGEWWWAGGGPTGAQGAFDFAGPGSGYTIALSFQCPSDDNVIGSWVHMGAWGEDGFVADSDGSLFTTDEGAEPFSDGERDRVGIVIELPETRESLVAEHCGP